MGRLAFCSFLASWLPSCGRLGSGSLLLRFTVSHRGYRGDTGEGRGRNRVAFGYGSPEAPNPISVMLLDSPRRSPEPAPAGVADTKRCGPGS